MRNLAIIFLAAVVLLGQAALTNQDVIRIKQAGLSDPLIVKKIGAGKNNFDLSANGLVELKNAGVSDTVIRAMMGLPPKQEPSAPVSAPEPEARAVLESAELSSMKTHVWKTPENYGVFAESGDALIPLPIWQGPLKSNKKRALATASSVAFWAKTKNGAHLPGTQSKLRLDPGVRFAIKMSEARVPNLRLVTMDVADGAREAVVSGRVWSSHSNEENGVPFDLVRLDSELFRMVVREPLKPGEYGIIDLSTYNQSTATVYEFGVSSGTHP